MTGVEALDVLVNNPQQLVIAFDTNGDLLQESPVGSGTMIPLSPPIPLPTGASMQTAKAYNRIYMAFSNLMKALGPPQVIDGPTGVVSPVSQTRSERSGRRAPTTCRASGQNLAESLALVPLYRRRHSG